jgi:hypothetical protein
MKLLITIAVLVCLPAVGILYWRAKTRAFRAEVAIENLRLWREMVEDYRRKYPDDSLSKEVNVVEEAVYFSTHSPLRKKVMAKAWANVRKMTKYYVQECKLGKAAGDWIAVYANSDLEAAQKIVVGLNLRRVGKLGELRARVRAASNPENEIDFYADN